MPHCIIEHSSDIDGDSLLEPLFKAILQSNLFESGGRDIKIRSRSYSSYLTGEQKTPFIHVTVRMIRGRRTAQKLELSHLVANEMAKCNVSNCQVTAEIVDIDENTYVKIRT